MSTSPNLQAICPIRVQGLDPQRIPSRVQIIAVQENEGVHAVELGGGPLPGLEVKLKDGLAVAMGAKACVAKSGANVTMVVNLAIFNDRRSAVGDERRLPLAGSTMASPAMS